MCSTLSAAILLSALVPSTLASPSIPAGALHGLQWKKPFSPSGGSRYYPKRSTQPTSFSVNQIRNPEFDENLHRNGLQALVHAYAKYGVELTPEIKKAVRMNPSVTEISLQKRSGNMTGTTPAVPPHGFDWEFISPVQIGTPPQTVYLDLDTGSADLWVFSADTPLEQSVNHEIYDPYVSNTSTLVPNQTWRIQYGDGSGASGIVYTDRVSVGNATSPHQLVECATYVSKIFSSDPYCSGILGLGMSHGLSRTLSNFGNPIPPSNDSSSPTSRTFIDNIKDDLVSPVFTANLKHSIEGNYNFGYLNASEYIPNPNSPPADEGIAYAPIDPKSVYWTFLATGYGVGPPVNDFEPTAKTGNPVIVGQSLMAINRTYTAIADTGTTLLLVPSQIVRAYYARVTGSVYDPFWAGMIFPCEAELPDFSFYIGPGGSTYRGVVPGRYMNYVSFNGSHCYGGIQSSDAIGFAVFGVLLIKSQFVVFDVGQKRIGFAGKELTT
ncbi:endothiapepsin [Rhypophila decipiens]|uniref:Endothiapepsin n=1 Tax=Rhypophila decipiens TaxID=261697 RepID=A0AAN6XW40_9PEZI|nr:endothiapepsin [Rhypophila decipiens]